MRISDWSSDVCSSDLVQDGLDLRQQPRRALPGTAIAEFRRGDDADTDRIRTHFGDTCGDGALRISGKLGDDIGVEHIEPAHRSMAFAGRNVSSTSGNWSSGPSGCKDARNSRDRKDVVQGKRVSVRVDLGDRRTSKKKKQR